MSPEFINRLNQLMEHLNTEYEKRYVFIVHVSPRIPENEIHFDHWCGIRCGTETAREIIETALIADGFLGWK